MPVLTTLLLLTIYLYMLAYGVPNKRNDENFALHSHLRPRDVSTNSTGDTYYPSSNVSGSLRAPLSNTTGSRRFPIASGSANYGSSFGSSGVVPYPTEGAPYQNSTALYTTQGNGEGEKGLSGSGTQCPSQQTVTLPPQTITLPAQTFTVTPAPETITITTQAQTETVTVTVTPQTQTTTVTVWITVTAGQASSCPSPSNAANLQFSPVPAPTVQPSITPIAPVFDDASTPAIVSPFITTPNLVVPIPTGVAVPIAIATSSVIPNLAQTTTAGPTFSENDQPSPLAQQTLSSIFSSLITSTPIIAPYRYPNATNQTLPNGSGSSRGFRPTGSGFAAPTSGRLSTYFVSKFVTDTPISTIIIGSSATKEYFPGNGSSLLTPPYQANATIFQPTAGPTAPPSPTMEYFPDDGSSLLTPPAQANATVSPTREYFPDNGSSLLKPPAQANITSVPPIGGPTAPIVTPAVVSSSQTLVVVVTTAPPPSPPILQSNTSTSIPPISTPIPPPSPPTIHSNTSIPTPPSTSSSQSPQPSTTSTSSLCTNGTTTQNITTNFSEIPPIPSTPLILQGLNYTTFTPITSTTPNTTSSLPPPTHLLALPASEPKQISLAPGSLSFSLTDRKSVV